MIAPDNPQSNSDSIQLTFAWISSNDLPRLLYDLRLSDGRGQHHHHNGGDGQQRRGNETIPAGKARGSDASIDRH